MNKPQRVFVYYSGDDARDDLICQLANSEDGRISTLSVNVLSQEREASFFFKDERSAIRFEEAVILAVPESRTLRGDAALR